MPTESEILVGIAQIGATFVGFAALVGVVGDRSRGGRYNVERLRTVIVVSALIVVAPLVPLVMASYGLSVAVTWRISSGLSLILNWGALGIVIAYGQSSGLHVADRIYTLDRLHDRSPT